MIGVNPLRTKVLCTTDEVIFHAPTDHQMDPRVLLQSIIVAERRFIKPAIGDNLYNLLVTNKNVLVTISNKAALQVAVNEGRGTDREEIILTTGDYVNSDTFLNQQQQDLWNYILHKVSAECIWFSSLPVNRARTTSKGVVKNLPENIAQSQESVTVDLKDLKHLMDRGLQDRIAPLMEDMHQYMCSVAYPGYTKDCGCDKQDGVKKKSDIVLGMYDDDEDDCKCGSPVPTAAAAPARNEIIPFENVSSLIIPWTPARKTQFGDAGAIHVELLVDGNTYQQVNVSIVPDDISNTTVYTIDFGGESSGRVIIS